MIYLVILAAIVARFIPHLSNAAPITALAIFSAAQLDWKKAAGITLAARLVSDLFLGFFSWPLMLAVYASHLAGVVFGVWIRQSSDEESLKADNLQELRSPSSPLRSARDDGKNRWLKIIGSSLAASILFFLVTNFAFLYAEYPHNLSGILQSYINGLPFLRGTLIGDLGYTAALFGTLALAKYFASRPAKIVSNFRPLL